MPQGFEDITMVEWGTKLQIPFAVAKISAADSISRQRLLIFNPDSPGHLQNLEGQSFESEPQLGQRLLQEIRNGKQIFFCEAGSAALKQITLDPQVTEMSNEIDGRTVISKKQGPVISEKNTEELFASQALNAPNPFKQFLNMITGGWVFADEMNSYRQQQSFRVTINAFLKERGNVPLENEIAEYKQRFDDRQNQLRVQNIEEDLGRAADFVNRMQNLMSVEARPPEDLSMGAQIAATVIKPPGNMDPSDCRAFTTAVTFSREAMTNLDSSTGSGMNDPGDSNMELINNLLHLTNNVFRAPDPRFQNIQTGIIRGRTTANEVLREMAEGDLSTAGKLVGDGVRNMMDLYRLGVNVGGVGGLLESTMLQGAFDLLDHYPDLQQAANITEQEMTSLKGMAATQRAAISSQNAFRDLMVDTPAPDTPKRAELLSRMLSAKLIGLTESDAHGRFLDQFMNSVGGSDLKVTLSVQRRQMVELRSMPDSTLLQKMSRAPRETMNQMAKIVSDTPTFQRLMGLDVASLRNSFAGDNGFSLEKITNKMVSEVDANMNHAEQGHPQAEADKTPEANNVAEAQKAQQAKAARATIPVA